MNEKYWRILDQIIYWTILLLLVIILAAFGHMMTQTYVMVKEMKGA